MSSNQLESLFKACDKTGTGKIGLDDFRELCMEFDILEADCVAIFNDLDHDGDGQISLEDFAWGFRDFLRSPQARKGSAMEFETLVCKGKAEALQLVQRRHSEARNAWANLVAGVGEPAVRKFLNQSGSKLADLYTELRSVEATPQLLATFEGAISSLIDDVKTLHEENKKLEDMFNREHERHIGQLRNLEEELDSQVAKVEAKAREEARQKFEGEKKSIVKKMETEIMELQTHLRLFKKVNNVLTERKEKDKDKDRDLSDESEEERRQLKLMLADKEANLAILSTEMAQLRTEYEGKCMQLNSQHATLCQYQNQTDQIHQKLRMLQRANNKLQDTNDSLLMIMDTGGRSPACYSPASSIDSDDHLRKPKWAIMDHRTPSPHSQVGDSNYFIPVPEYTVEYADSGRSTLREQMDYDLDSHSYLEQSRNSEGEYHNISLEEQNITATSTNKLVDSLGSGFCDLEPTGPPDRTYKIVFAGDAAVGKSCFIHRFSKGIFAVNLGSTLGVDFQVKTIRIDMKNITLQLWDTAGQERFRSMTKTYFRRSDGVILIYDTTNERSFLNVRHWLQSIEDCSTKKIPIYLCGNKVDLREEAKLKGITCVSTEQGQRMAKENGAIFYETSSKTGHNITNVIVSISRDMLTLEDDEVLSSGLVPLGKTVDKKCC
ncbi:ras and EF-hand domain-containing protein homolog isoform X2 [Macrosteles quadrilineatus]|nr:ras and EF-hand domain-containing protein homolog isoform X2 [Macrosteles quadrilineatus]XP_054281082.1 ras and EF-hand domain-containing protein homolog isoform X2 [Macrosteles quadrilineatus]